MYIRVSKREARGLRYLLTLYNFAEFLETKEGCHIDKGYVHVNFDKSLKKIKEAENYASANLDCFMHIMNGCLKDFSIFYRYVHGVHTYTEDFVGLRSLFLELLFSERYVTKFYKVITDNHYTRDGFVAGPFTKRVSLFYSLVEKWCKICHECLTEMVNPTEEQEMYYSKIFIIKGFNVKTLRALTCGSSFLNFKAASNAVKGILPGKFASMDIKGSTAIEVWEMYDSTIVIE